MVINHYGKMLLDKAYLHLENAYSRPPQYRPSQYRAHFQVPNRGFVCYNLYMTPNTAVLGIPPLFRQSQDRRY